MEKTLREVITFNSTTDAIAFEKYCKNSGVEGRLIPVPRAISASCGLCWSAPAEEQARIEEAISAADLKVVGKYQMMV